MTIKALLQSIYLGDRACKSIAIDGWNKIVRLQVTCISRVRSPSGQWDYYTDEDIIDGVIVFTGVESCELRNDGWVLNDLINSCDVVEEVDGGATIELSIDAVDTRANHHETFLRVRCAGMHLEDPRNPDRKVAT